MKFNLKIESFTYSGRSIGRDIAVHVRSDGINWFKSRRIRPITYEKWNENISIIQVERLPHIVPIEFEVTEKDYKFSEKGIAKGEIEIKQSDDQSRLILKLQVSEKRFVLWKTTATFEAVFSTMYIGPTVDAPKWTGDFADDSDQIILARALFGEARSTLVPDKARYAIAWVIRNRVIASKGKYSYHDVITKPEQFSSFSIRDYKNRPYVEDPLHIGNIIDVRAWQHAYEIAGKVISNSVSDPTKGATHYYDDSIEAPPWAKNLKPILTITYTNENGHMVSILFFKL